MADYTSKNPLSMGEWAEAGLMSRMQRIYWENKGKDFYLVGSTTFGGAYIWEGNSHSRMNMLEAAEIFSGITPEFREFWQSLPRIEY
jgi:hypothetical protein